MVLVQALLAWHHARVVCDTLGFYRLPVAGAYTFILSSAHSPPQVLGTFAYDLFTRYRLDSIAAAAKETAFFEL